MATNNPKSNSNSKPKHHRSNKGKGRTENSVNPKPSAELEKGNRDNDPNWYFTDKTVADQAGQLSFQNFLGSEPLMGNYFVPDIITAWMNPCPGMSYRPDNPIAPAFSASDYSNVGYTNAANAGWRIGHDGLNFMASKLYTLLATYSGRNQSYGPEDISLMLLAIGSVAENIEYIRRAFGVAMIYNQRNRMLPLGLINAMRIDADDLVSHMADYRMKFNVAIARVNQIPILGNIGFIAKCRDLYQKLYNDDTTSMAQIFMMCPASFWQYDDTYTGFTKGGGRLTTIDNTVGTMLSKIELLNSQVDALLFSSAFQIIYADLLNLANKISVPMFQFDYLTETYTVFPEFNANASLQFHNLTVVGAPTTYEPQSGTTHKPWSDSKIQVINQTQAGAGKYMFYTVSNDVNTLTANACILYNPLFATAQSAAALSQNRDAVVDMFTENPSVEDRIEAMRYIALPSRFIRHHFDDSADHNTDTFRLVESLPDHYCVGITVSDHYPLAEGETPLMISSSNVATSDANLGKIISNMSQVEKAPMLYLTSGFNTVATVFGQLSFFTKVGYDYFLRLNNLIYCGLFEFR